MRKQSVLFAASEVYPFAKTGGLADVGYSLPKALSDAFDVTVVMPLYDTVDRQRFGIEGPTDYFDVMLGKERRTVSVYESRFEGRAYFFVYEPQLCDRDYLYGPPGEGYDDNAQRFGLFSYAITELARRLQSDIVHLNDWQTALAALIIAEDDTLKAATVYTIHNLAYQGEFPKSTLPALGVDKRHFTLEGIEFYDRINLMKAGIGYADAVTTVSPTYAEEILTHQFGCGLEGYLQHHRAKVTGIANGIDAEHFAPQSDSSLFRPYKTPRGKQANKKHYLAEVGLSEAELPLFIFIGRFTWQKGIDLLLEALPQMASLPCNIAVLGEGEPQYAPRFEKAAEAHPNIHLFFGYDEALAHRMYAAADFLLMPSLFEPCGLNQLIAAHYGAVPVVHRVGGLADTVAPVAYVPEAQSPCGIAFDAATPEALLDAFAAALRLFNDAKGWGRVAAHNMKADVSWRRSAASYTALYRKISGSALK
ncbi:glycogen synthase [Sulfurimonas sp. HSL-3221]|uniref:glycogen synthase n=1 Tax=Sulfurimonadaceae TaxID=2771471 RepID=UPI001E2E4BB1|nr:glycogen/starch synthase [Sulfurimonas sp. HSL-3221]UFS61393.1 glycogen synthase [Sulfurimonas sp. HSL-3221]